MFLLIYLCKKLSSGVSGGDDEARGSGRGGFGSEPHFPLPSSLILILVFTVSSSTITISSLRVPVN